MCELGDVACEELGERRVGMAGMSGTKIVSGYFFLYTNLDGMAFRTTPGNHLRFFIELCHVNRHEPRSSEFLFLPQKDSCHTVYRVGTAH